PLFCSEAPAQALINVVPEPNSIVIGQGNYLLSRSTTIVRAKSLEKLGGYLSEQLGIFTHLRMHETVSANRKKNLVTLKLDKSFRGPNPEAYELEVTPVRITLKAKTEVGLFRGMQTLLQLIPLPDSSNAGKFNIPACKIVDYPRFAWRGLNLDCVRHFMTKDFIKRYIDLLAYYKFNVFHWHLTDDQGWRIQIKKYPKLTEIGAWRKEADGQIYGGYYTQKDIKEIVAYAKSRFITVVPEIEMPGHCEASLASYPENACVPGPFEVGTQWGVYKDIYNPGKKSTFTFLENVLDEVLKLFPSHYIHIGGDEVPKVEWKENALCQELMKRKGLQNEEQLQSYFIRKIQKFLESKGRQIIGWDEILEGKGPDSGGVVESWRGIDGAVQAAKSGHSTILAPGGYTYLSQDADGLSLDTVYSFDPMPPGLTPEQQKYVLGTEASMWSEHAPQETVDSKMFPRILAIAEDAWTNPARKNYADFHERLQTQYRRLAYLGVDYGLERKAISYQTTFNKEKKAFTINLTPTQAGIELRYAIGDTLTMAESRLYGRPVTISSTATFITQAEMNGRLVGNPIYLSFITDKALDAGISVEEPYSPEYSAGGVKSLVDGIRGTKNFRDGLWQGYKGTDIDAAVDLKKEETISQVGAGFYQSISSYIFMPTSVEFFVSKDGAHFDSVGVVENNVPDKDPDTFIKDFTLSFKPREVRYVRMVAKSIGVCPPWHIGAGAKAWLFIDEIFAN
ncbi:MAG: hypothetical protein B7Z63_01810, partial [Ignavibacteriae bacterium 37-53-5]